MPAKAASSIPQDFKAFRPLEQRMAEFRIRRLM
jgi:hypothetical protein